MHSRRAPNVKRLLDALSALEAYYREHPGSRPKPDGDVLTGPGHHLLMTRDGALDVLGEVSGGLGFEELQPLTEVLELEAGLRIRVLSLEALIQLKERLAGEKDLATLAILRRTLDEIS